MKTIKEVANMAGISRQTVYYRIERIESIIGERVKKEYVEGLTNPDRIVSDEIARMVVNFKREKPGRKPALKNSAVDDLTKDDIDEVLK